jgi:photosystem II stability/assembly factor-like uncharacterized protein
MASSRVSVAAIVFALVVVACTSATSPTGRITATPTTSSTPSPSPTSAPQPHRYVNVDSLNAISRSLTVATVSRCFDEGSVTQCKAHLEVTEDMGKTWSDITPAGLPMSVILQNPFFLDEEHGWVAAEDCAGDASRSALYRTSDGGRTWQRTPVAPTTCNAGAGLSPVFIDPSTGWLERVEPTAPFASLEGTHDGGRTWTKERQLPMVGPVSFVNASDGWQAGGYIRGKGALARSRDAGDEWRRVEVPLPACCPSWQTTYGLPKFFGADGVLPFSMYRAHKEVVGFDVSADAGDSWLRAATLRLRNVHPNSPSVVGIGSAASLWVAPGGSTIYRTNDAGQTWRPSGVPTEGDVIQIDPIGGRAAWLVMDERQKRMVFLTQDGGRTWHRVVPDAVRDVGAASASIHAVVDLRGGVIGLASGDGGVLYAAYRNGPGLAIARIDTMTGSVTYGPRLRGGWSGNEPLAVAEGSVWVAGQEPRSPRASNSLYRLDADTLDLQVAVRMPAPPVAAVAVPAGVWVAAGRRLLLLDPVSGMAVRTMRIAGAITDLAADPTGNRLYVATSTGIDNQDHVLFLELSAWTGTTLVSARGVGFADLGGPSAVAPTDDGVWIATPTGMMGTLTLLRASDLRQVATYRPGGSNGITASLAAGVLWIPSLLGGYVCVDPATGEVRGHVGIKDSPYGSTDVVAAGSSLYIGAGTSLDRLTPPPTCSAT